jgi:general secretion pathway protein E
MDLAVDSAAVRTSLPFGYAQQHRVLLEEGADNPVLVHQGQPGASVLAEVRRVLGVPFGLQAVSDEEFQRRLTLAYQRGNNEAVQMATSAASRTPFPRPAT